MKIFVAVAVALGMGSAAMASGPVTPPYVPPVMVPAPMGYDWSGGYLGLGVTYGRGGMETDVAIPSPADASGPGLSAIAGYNWQNGNLVYGAEVALDFARRSGVNDCGTGNPLIECTTYQNNHASIRGRVGMAMDRTLIFATFGYATDLRRIRQTTGGVTVFHEMHRYNGPMIGVGVERALSDRWSIRGDLEHYFLGTQTFGVIPVEADTNLVRISAVRRF